MSNRGQARKSPGAKFIDLEPSPETFLDSVLAGLSATPKTLPSKFFYDERGSLLFQQITTLDPYYPTRTETALLKQIAPELGALIPEHAELVEFGSGSTNKVRILLDTVGRFSAYVSIDISRTYLVDQANQLARDYPGLSVLAVCADYMAPLNLDDGRASDGSRVGFFPGSTIGNLTSTEAIGFLANAANILGPGAGFIVGVDLKKDRKILEAAYNDPQGITAAFNLNLLIRLNRELDADFDTAAFAHEAIYKEDAGRIEMHLVSQKDQFAHIGDRKFRFAQGESIHTENSHKYSIPEFQDIARAAGLNAVKFWTDPDQLFSIHFLRVKGRVKR